MLAGINRQWVSLFDIDNFKRINDTYGRTIGDLVLVQFADLICEKKRDEDLLGRYGGEKFIILPHGEVDKKNIHKLCERIRRAVERFKFCHADACVQITVTIGFHLDILSSSKYRYSFTVFLTSPNR